MNKVWLYTTIAVAVVLSFVLSDSFRQVISRRRSIRATEAELRQVESQVTDVRERLTRLQTDPSAYENLVRQELGYLRPGEKEARFLKK
jgi:cell division protein FtsB